MKDKIYIRDGRAPIPGNETTSRIMSGNKGKNTKPEIALRKEIWKQGLRGYRTHYRQIVGTADIAFTKSKLAVFINGCFWHRCPHCNPSQPKSNIDFWTAKFNRNIERDRKKKTILELNGWDVLVIWECEIKKDLEGASLKIKEKLERKNNEQ